MQSPYSGYFYSTSHLSFSFQLVSGGSNDVHGVNVEVEGHVVVVAHHNHVHPEVEAPDAGGPPGDLPSEEPAGPVGVTPEAVALEVQVRLGSHH